MKPGLVQQAVAGLAVLLVIAATVLGAVLLAINDNPDALAGQIEPSPTTYRIPTLMLSPLATASPPSSPSPTARPATSTPIPTQTAAPSRTPTSPATLTPPPAICRVPTGWVPYTVRPGDNLFRIGLAYGLTVDQLLAGNCRTAARVSAGEVIYVPPVTPVGSATPIPTAAPGSPAAPTPTEADPTPEPTQPPTQSATDGACTNPDSMITSPPVGAVLSGTQEFYGSAVHPNFSFYKLEIRREGTTTPADFVTFHTGYSQVSNGLLGMLSTEAFENGQYWIRLVVVDSTGNYPERCSYLYTISN
ncbi:MAG: hypothetical protein Kow00124_21170 [Anaerolineae bacterium]